MPMNETPLPVGVENPKITVNGVDYYLIVGTETFTRAGVEGNDNILPLFAGDENVGEVLEGHWKKGWSADMATFTARINSGVLEMTGVAGVAGVFGYGWLNSSLPFVMCNEAEHTVEMEIPISDTGVAAARDAILSYYLVSDKLAVRPGAQGDMIQVQIDVDEDGLFMSVYTRINSAWALIFGGSTYDGASARDPAADKFTIWRLVFHDGVAGAAAPEDVRHLHIYLKQGVDRAGAESADEHELGDGTEDSPYDISGLLFNVSYPAWTIATQNTTYFGTAIGSANGVASTYCRVSYPDMELRHNYGTDADRIKGDVELWDTMGSATESDWQRVLDEDHVFAGDAVVQNGLFRLYIDEGITLGLKLYYWTGAAWAQVANWIRFIPLTNAVSLSYPTFKSIVSVTPDKVSVNVRNQDSSADNDVFLDTKITLERGKYSVLFEPETIFPVQDMEVQFLNISTLRFGYSGDDKIGDDDLGVTGTNATLSDNFLVLFDDAGPLALGTISVNLEPDAGTTDFVASDGGDLKLRNFSSGIIPTLKIWFSLTPFPLVANLFEEAEDATISAAVRNYMDGDGVDTVCENDGVWAATANCAIIENQAGGEESVGAVCVRITSTGAGFVQATCVPAAPLGKLTKFDFIKFYAHHGGVLGTDLSIWLIDADGDYMWKQQAITGSAVEYTFDLPHSDADKQGWTEVNTFDYETLTSILFGWTAPGAGEIVYIDGLREYIGTTTTRGRGETLSGGEAMVLDAPNERSFIDWNTLDITTDLPAGRYLMAVRAKDTDNVASDLGWRPYNETDSSQRSQENEQPTKTLTSSFAYYFAIFDIQTADDGDRYTIRAMKLLATENTMFIDYFLIIPIGDGESFPQDLAHAAMRVKTLSRKVFDR